LQVGNTHATRGAILFKNLNYILREIYDILSEDALNYPVRPINSTYYSALAKVDIFVVFTTLTFCYQSLGMAPSLTFIATACNAVTYEVFQIC